MRLSTLAFALALTGCSTILAVVGTDHAPSVIGELTVKSGDGETLILDLRLDGLPPPERIDADSHSFWAFSVPHDGAPPVLLGRLGYDPTHRQGTLRATTTLSEFTVLVTAGPAEPPEGPSDVWVARRSYPDGALAPSRWRQPVYVPDPEEEQVAEVEPPDTSSEPDPEPESSTSDRIDDAGQVDAGTEASAVDEP